MFLVAALFATIGTAIATGGYIYYVLNLFFDDLDAKLITTIAGLATVALFALVQWVGSKRQAQLMEWMTYGDHCPGLVLDRLYPAVRIEPHPDAAALADGLVAIRN